ncbi:LysR substrate-binding domain-containing protein [Janthinobacterium psychrotolerans]|uniref:DNA-binding transcriptional regulator, LysR family n=1 Tax=Janthinobacterium psychrotolerans TaxID=1747903 RepID=A0A1A7C3T1_9BURK|nr:LysR substrate-binding domain-containing protein [Janthinobacterium psychrotolerans]OBV38963.1 DNA-binding transcriptional regulator, LysR family [Janthinobacterium psychrotolerans]
MRFDLVDLQLFVHVVEEGSLTAGAARSHLALASASARVRGMEQALGMALLLRGRRGVTVTPAGQTLLHHARLVLLQMDKLRGDLGEFARGLQGQLRLLCNTSALSEFLPEALATFLERHPNLTIDLEERLSYDIVKGVSEGQADIGIVSDSVDLRGLQTFLFRPDRLVAIVAADGVRQRAIGEADAIDFASLLESDFIGLADDSALQQYLGLQAARLGRPLKVRVRLRSFDAVCRMVASGAGVAVVPQSAARRCQQTMALRCLALLDPWSVRNLTICVRQFGELPLYARQLVEHLQA